mmetsp:Transcript_56674/g.137762  ORF Transcript_56674/g.137762 Transcript_56674/m.137762 type:complete len:671 (-) Transcript_56674:87-2099(-)
MFLVPLLKPFVVVWAGLNLLDDISWGVKLTRLIGASIPFPFLKERPSSSSSSSSPSSSSEDLCGLCDDVMEGMLRGSEGIQAVPCNWLCLRIPACVKMCTRLQESADSSSKFPCSAAGYCSDLPPGAPGDDFAVVIAGQVDCQRGPLWSCEPRQFCRRRFRRMKFTCEYKPGMGRWMQIQQTAASHTAAIASSLIKPKRCTEPDAGPYCIAEPAGFGKLCEVFGGILSVVYGGYQSLLAIETPGGDDDQQWLTFWVISVTTLVVEHNFARVLLSKFPMYYEAKLILLVWLMLYGGAIKIYRWLRRKLMSSSTFLAEKLDRQQGAAAQEYLEGYIDIGGQVITRQIQNFEKMVHRRSSTISRLLSQRWIPEEEDNDCWELDISDDPRNGGTVDPVEMLYLISKWMLSVEGIQKLDKEKVDGRLDHDAISILLERASSVVSFQPRYVNIILIGTKPGSEGKLPPMDHPSGKADCYVKCRLVQYDDTCDPPSQVSSYPERGIRSKTIYRTLRPKWNERMEIGLRQGKIDSFGSYISNNEARKTRLLVEAWDADLGFWGMAFELLLVAAMILTVVSIVGYVTGFLDVYVSAGWMAIFGSINGMVALGLVLSYVLSTILGVDDEIIGTAEIPLEILLDQKEHGFLVHLQDPDPTKGTKYHNGERGILRLKLSLSE